MTLNIFGNKVFNVLIEFQNGMLEFWGAVCSPALPFGSAISYLHYTQDGAWAPAWATV